MVFAAGIIVGILIMVSLSVIVGAFMRTGMRGDDGEEK